MANETEIKYLTPIAVWNTKNTTMLCIEAFGLLWTL